MKINNLNINNKLHMLDIFTYGSYQGEQNDYLSIDDSSDWDIIANITESWTIDFWVKHNNITLSQTYVNQRLDDNNYWKLFFTNSDGIKFECKNDSNFEFSLITNVVPVIEEWTHIALIKINNKYGIYINGQQKAYYQTDNTVNFDTSLRIGVDYISSSYVDYFIGKMDEMRIYKGNPFNASPNSSKTDIISITKKLYNVDSNTKILLHFDGNFDDATGQHAVILHDSPKLSNDFKVDNIIQNDNEINLLINDNKFVLHENGNISNVHNNLIMQALQTTCSSSAFPTSGINYPSDLIMNFYSSKNSKIIIIFTGNIHPGDNSEHIIYLYIDGIQQDENVKFRTDVGKDGSIILKASKHLSEGNHEIKIGLKNVNTANSTLVNAILIIEELI